MTTISRTRANGGRIRHAKSPTVYLRDTELLHSFLGIRDGSDLRGHPGLHPFPPTRQPDIARSAVDVYPLLVTEPAPIDLALAALQDAIWRDKILQARAMTPAERFEGDLEQTNFVMRLMLDGTMSQLGIGNPSEGWRELRARMDRLRQAADAGFYVDSTPA